MKLRKQPTFLVEGVVNMTSAEMLAYEKELEENQRTVRQMVLDSLEDVRAGKGRDFNEFFDEVEKKYQNV